MLFLLALKGELSHSSKPWHSLIGANVHPDVLPSRTQRNTRPLRGDPQLPSANAAEQHLPAIVYRLISDVGAGAGYTSANDHIGTQRVQLSVYGKDFTDVATITTQLKSWLNVRPNGWRLGACCLDCPQVETSMITVANVYTLAYERDTQLFGMAIDVLIRCASGVTA